MFQSRSRNEEITLVLAPAGLYLSLDIGILVVAEFIPEYEYVDFLFVMKSDRRDPDLIPLEKVSELIKESLIREKTDIAIAEAQQTAMDRLREGVSVSAVADEFGLRWSSYVMVRRTTDQEIPQEVLSLAFQLSRPED